MVTEDQSLSDGPRGGVEKASSDQNYQQVTITTIGGIKQAEELPRIRTRPQRQEL